MTATDVETAKGIYQVLKLLRFSCRQAFYEYRARQWNLIFLALLFAVMMLSVMQFVADRAEKGLAEQSAQLLGGDLVIESSVPIQPNFREKATQLSLRTADIIVLQTMLNHAGEFILVNLQAVSPEYPLFGKPLALQAHHILINKRIQDNFNLTFPAQLKIGASSLTTTALIPATLELSYSGWLLAPRVVINLSDLSATQTLLPGSRASYRLLVAGDKANLRQFYNAINPLLTPQQKLVTPNQNTFQLLNNLNVIIQFVQLAVIVSIIFCGITISLSVRQYVKRHTSQIALWRSLGATTQQIRTHYILQLFLAAVVTMVVGMVIGYYAHVLLINYISPYYQFVSDAATLKPFFISGMASFVILFCYAYPYIQTLSEVNALTIWRGNHQATNAGFYYGIAAFIIFVLFVLLLMNFTLFSLFIIDCLTLGMAIFILASILSFSLLRRLAEHCRGTLYRGIKQIIQYPETSSTQISALALVLMCLFLLHFMKNDLLTKWQATIANDAPNYFAFNIAADEVAGLQQHFKDTQLTFFPMIRGRLIKLNNQPIFSVAGIDKSHNALHRDLNLSAGDIPRTGTETHPTISIESSLAKALHSKLGDKLTFLIYDKEITATVVETRDVNWESMQPNFYVIFSRDALQDFPVTYITSFYLPPQQINKISGLLNNYPNITLIDMADVLKQIQSWLNQAASVLQILFVFTLLSALLVLIAALIATGDDRRQTYSLIRLLGASKDYIIKSIFVEGIILTLLALLLAYLSASLIFYFLLRVLTNTA